VARTTYASKGNRRRKGSAGQARSQLHRQRHGTSRQQDHLLKRTADREGREQRTGEGDIEDRKLDEGLRAVHAGPPVTSPATTTRSVVDTAGQKAPISRRTSFAG
jgi:hypothetical protein